MVRQKKQSQSLGIALWDWLTAIFLFYITLVGFYPVGRDLMAGIIKGYGAFTDQLVELKF